jgi:hypothetical protein
MKRFLLSAAVLLGVIPSLAWGASALSTNTATATVFIANYDDTGNFLGWGSGFFVDEGVVVTNKHVIGGGDWYRVYATGADEAVDMLCYRKITKSDVKINLDDDVAYMRVFLPCAHGTLAFGDDPQHGDSLSILGYPYKGSTEASLFLSIASGSVIGREDDGWILTDAHLDPGNSGGPVIHGTDVIGVAVAKSVDDAGNYLAGYFIPSSVILKGLLYANDSGFGYTPSSRSSSSRSSSVSSSSKSSISSSVRSSSSSSSRRSAVSSSAPLETVTPGFQVRTCARVLKWFRGNTKMLGRINERLQKRFGFVCR